ncbi:MAG: hypothetical protein HY782_18410 [Chloroflexi bacterium]|nr:hypothetical protein [Chloroflexota bacterium]
MAPNCTVLREIASEIQDIENDASLADMTNFAARVAVIDRIEFRILDRLDGLGDLPELSRRAEGLQNDLEAINQALFRGLREQIRLGNCTGAAFRNEMLRYTGAASDAHGYDAIDVFVNGLLRGDTAPAETRPREPEMVFYQPTPARIVLELARKIGKGDVFYDLGSGLGQVTVLVNLLAGCKSIGIEFESAYCDYARGCAAQLELSRVEFVNADARNADYSDGTVFFMYTPFKGAILRRVLERLAAQARKRAITIGSYGPCTLDLSKQSWLTRMDQNGNVENKLAIFASSDEEN